MKNLLLLAVAGIAAAGAQACETRSLAGFYVGLNGGAVITSGQGKVIDLAAGMQKTLPKQSKTHGTFGIFGGYNYMINGCVLLGLEGYAQLMSKKISSEKSLGIGYTAQEKITQSPLIGAAIRTGYIINKNTLLYVRLGLEHFKHTFEFEYRNNAGVLIPERSIKKTSKSGFRANIGAGVEYYINPNMFVGCEYRYGLKKTVRGKTGNELYAAELTGSQHFLLAKVGYKF